MPVKPPLTGRARPRANHRARQDVEWLVLDEVATEVQIELALAGAGHAVDAPAHRHRLAQAALWGLACVALVGATTLLWVRAQAGLTKMEGEVATAVQGEALQEQVKSHRPHTAAVVNQVDFQSNAAMAEVVVTQTVALGKTVVQRQVQFYTLSPHGWQRSPPLDSFWGSPATLDTAHLHFVYRQLDGETVAQVAARSERLYRRLHALLGLADKASTALQMVEVVPAVVTQVLQPATGAIRLTSPRLLYAQPDESSAEILYATLKQALVRHVIEEAESAAPLKPQWYLMEAALHSWLLAAGDGTSSYPAQHVGVSGLAEIMPSVRPRLDAFLTCVACTVYYPGGGNAGYQVATQTDKGLWLVDFLVAKYGVEVLPRLLQGFATYDDWETLAPAVFGMPAAELEAAWQE